MNARHTSTTAPCSDTWKSDSIVGAKTVGEGIHTAVEPVSRFIIAWKIDALTAECGITAQHAIFGALPPPARLSVTMGNGTQDVPPLRAESPVGVWTRTSLTPTRHGTTGTNEHHNARIRRYLPTRTDFRTITDKELQEIITEINNQPQKHLNQTTPAETYQHHTQPHHHSAALQT